MTKRTWNEIAKLLASPYTRHDPMTVDRAQRVTVGPWKGTLLGSTIMLILAAVQCNLAAVQFRVLHSFPTNSYPQCTLVFGDDHALYGTTQMGGD